MVMVDKTKTPKGSIPTKKERERQVREYVNVHRRESGDDNIDPLVEAASFETKDKTVVYKNDYNGHTAVIDHRNAPSGKETLIPKGVKGLDLYYYASPGKDALTLEGTNTSRIPDFGEKLPSDDVTLHYIQPEAKDNGPNGHDKITIKGEHQSLNIKGGPGVYVNALMNNSTVVAPNGNNYIDAWGNGNTIITGKGDDTVVLYSVNGHVNTGDGNDLIIDNSLYTDSFGHQKSTILEGSYGDVISGGSGDDTYELQIALAGRDSKTANSRSIQLKFTKEGNALIESYGAPIAQVNKDVEHFSLEVFNNAEIANYIGIPINNGACYSAAHHRRVVA
jgi:hypothetical protein